MYFLNVLMTMLACRVLSRRDAGLGARSDSGTGCIELGFTISLGGPGRRETWVFDVSRTRQVR